MYMCVHCKVPFLGSVDFNEVFIFEEQTMKAAQTTQDFMFDMEFRRMWWLKR